MGVAYRPQLLARATAYQARPLTEKRSPAGLEELAGLWSAIQGQPAGSCRQCQYSDFLAAVTAYVRQATHFLFPELMSDSTYSLAPAFAGETFVHEGYNKVVTADTLADEDAEFFIKNGYGHAFVKKDGSPTLTLTPESTPEGDKPKLEKKADFQARFTGLLGTEPADKLTIADLTQHIEAKEADPAYVLPVA